MKDSEFSHQLAGRLKEWKIELSLQQIEKLAAHYAILVRWGRVHNLSSVLSLEEAVEQHYVDSVVGLSFLDPKEKVFDAGSGAGFPGLVAGVMWPSSHIFLIEPSKKKCSFLETAIQEMRLSNVSVIQDRIEDQKPASLVLSRAAFSTSNLQVVARAVDRSGHLALWLSKSDLDETSEILKSFNLYKSNVFEYKLRRGGLRAILVVERST